MDDADHLVLERLPQIRRVLEELRGDMRDMREDMRDIKARMSALEGGFGTLAVAIASQSARMDRIDSRLERQEHPDAVL